MVGVRDEEVMITAGAVGTVGPVGASRVRAGESGGRSRPGLPRQRGSLPRRCGGGLVAGTRKHRVPTPVDIEITMGPAMNGLPKPFREVERAGLEPATPSLQIRSNGGLNGSVMVKFERTRHHRHCVEAAEVGVRHRDLTRI